MTLMSDVISGANLVEMLLLMITSVYSQCATYDSYCLTGLSPSDHGSFIAGRYDYQGTNEGCKYFENTQIPDSFNITVYLHWDTGNSKWYIGDNLYDTTYWAYCTYSSLDSCTNGQWYRYDGSSTNSDYSMSIGTCNYDDTACLTQYNNTFGKYNHYTDQFCIRNTRDRSVNAYTASSFYVSGCYETKTNYTSTNVAYLGFLAIGWDEELSVWQLTNQPEVVSSGYVGYCTYSDLQYCSNNWYIFDGSDHTKDSQVISGLCNTCTDTNYNKFCIYGGLDGNHWDAIIAIYKYDKCTELMHSYKHATYDDYYLSNGTFGNLTLQYNCAHNSWYININYNSSLLIAKCEEIDNPMQCSGNWSVYDPIQLEMINITTVQSGSCDVIYQQCFYGNEKDEQYICISEDSNDGSVLHNEFYYKYVAGEFKYLECDQDGFPVYVRHRDNEGNYLNETWYNRSMITFDSTIYIFSVHKYNKTLKGSNKGHWLYCRALLLELCDTFFSLFNNNTNPGKWIPQPSIRISKRRCSYSGSGDSSAISWFWYAIAAALVLLCCIGALIFCIKRRKKKSANEMAQNGYKRMPDDGKSSANKARVNQSNYNAPQPTIPSMSNANQTQRVVVVQTIPNTATQTKLVKQTAKKSISKKKVKKKDSYHEPPPYNPNYDENRSIEPQISISEMEMENVNDKREVDNESENDNAAHALDVVGNDTPKMNEKIEINRKDTDYESLVATWSKEDVVDWVENGINLSDKWKEIAVNAVKNAKYDGKDLIGIKSGKDIAKLFGIKNPMLCSRLWKELKQYK